MRMARGSGSGGLSAARTVQVMSDGSVFVRPLINQKKEFIQSALKKARVTWREDATNGGTDFFRTRVRARVVPVWRKASPNDALVGAALSRELLEEDDLALNLWLNELWPAGDDTILDLLKLAGKPRALLRRALHRWRLAVGLEFFKRGFDELLARCEQGTDFRMSAGRNRFAVVSGGRLRAELEGAISEAGTQRPFLLKEGEARMLSDGAQVASERVIVTAGLRKQIFAGKFVENGTVFVKAHPLNKMELCVRSWKSGDRYLPLGAPGVSKLQDLFVNRKIPLVKRRKLPIFASLAGVILWVPGLPPAESHKITSETSVALRLTYASGTSTLNP